jgi:hypothetical protein
MTTMLAIDGIGGNGSQQHVVKGHNSEVWPSRTFSICPLVLVGFDCCLPTDCANAGEIRTMMQSATMARI